MFEPGGRLASGGSRWSCVPSRTTRNVLVTNSGSDDPASPNMTITRSTIVSLRRAASVPAKMPSGTVITRARMASLAEFCRVVLIRSLTGCPVWKESPKSNVTICFSRCRYWSVLGWSVPSLWFIASTVSWDANGPRIERPTSCGSTFEIANTIRLSSSSVMIARASRRAMKRSMGCLAAYPLRKPARARCASGDLSRLSEEPVADRRHLDPGELLRMSGEVVEEVREQRGRVLEQQLLDRLGRRLLRVDAHSRLEVLEQLGVLVAVVLRRVPCAMRAERGVQVDVGRPAMAVVDD